MRRLTAWTLLGPAVAVALLAAPAVLESLRPPGAREAWRRDILVVDPLEVALSMVEGDRRILILDAREAEEFAEAHIPTARHVPLRKIRAMDLGPCREADLVIPYCLKDLRGYEAAKLLKKRGIDQVALFDGFGLASWEAARLPLAGAWSGLDDATAFEDLRELGGSSALAGSP